MSKVVPIQAAEYIPILEEINAAFVAVFGDEALQTVAYSREDGREVFTITSDRLTRTYLRKPEQSFEELLRTVPHLPPDKNE